MGRRARPRGSSVAATLRRGIARTGEAGGAGVVGSLAVVLLAGLWIGHVYGAGAIRAFWTGSVGSWYSLTSGTLVRAVPLILAGLGVAIAFRAGVFNIGAEGQLLAGAIAAAFVGLQWADVLGRASVLCALVLGVVAGACWAGIAALLRSRFGVLEVISTLMLNFIAEDLVSYLVRGPLQEHLHIYPQTEMIPPVARLGRLIPAARLHWGIVLAVALALVAWWTLSRTAAGFRLRMVGANPYAAAIAGRINVSATSTDAFLISGALAGLAGAIEVTGVTYALYENISPGYGFTAIAVAVLAGLHPLGVIATGILFAALETGATAMQRDAGVPAVWASVIEATLILIIVAAVSVRSRRLAGAHEAVDL